MKRLLCTPVLLAAFLYPVLVAGASDWLFVFHGEESYATVYDPGSLSRKAMVAVEPGAFAAFAADGGKLYVLSESAITILGADFTVHGRLPLPERVVRRADAAALSYDLGRLVVVAGRSVYIVDTETDSIVARLEPGFAPLGVAVRPGDGFAYVTAAGSGTLGKIDLVEARLLPETAQLPAPVTALGVAGRGSRIYGGTFGALFDLDRLPESFFRSGESSSPAPVIHNRSQLIERLLVADSERFFGKIGGAFFTGKLRAGESITELLDPVTGEPLGDRAVDVALSPDGRGAFVAIGDEARLVKFNPEEPAAAQEVDLGAAPTGLALVSAIEPLSGRRIATPQAETPPRTADQLLMISPNGLSVLQNSQVTLVVEARTAGQADVGVELTITTTPGSPTIACPQTVLTGFDGRGLIVCNTGPVTINTGALIQVSDGFNIVTFSITILATGIPGDGLSKVSGDNQFVLQNSAFPQPLAVLAKDDGQPQVGLMLSATPRDDLVVCTSFVFTDANGEGQISCVAGAVDENTEVKIDVADSLERELPDPFRATITTELVEADKLELLTDPMVEGDVGSTVLNAITVRALDDTEGELQGVPIYFWSTDDLSFDPAVGISDENGEATTSVTFGCPLNMGNIFVGLEPAGRQIVVPFRANPGPPTLITKLQGDNQSGNPGELLDQVALLVEVTDICGNPADGEAVTWTVNPPQAAELVNFITTTDFRGRSGGLVRLGNFGGPFTITATTSGITAVFNLTVINAPAKIVAISGDGQTVALGQAAPQQLVVETRSDEDVAVGAVDLTFRVIAGSATVSPPNATTNAFGRASATVTAGDTLGPIIVEAAGPGFSVRFTLSTAGRVPALTAVSFVNGASFLTGWVPGGTGTIFGVGLMEGVVGPVFAPGPPFPTVFRGVSVSVNGRPLPILSMANVNGQEQINVQVDFDISPGPATVVINNNGSTASISGVQILDVQPGVFEVSVGGGRFAAALHANFSLVTPSNPARPGEIILLFLTGMGPLIPPVGTNVPGPIPPAATMHPAVVGIDDVGMETLASVYAPTLVTAYQVNFRVGDNVQSGNRRLVVIVNGIPSQPALLPVGR